MVDQAVIKVDYDKNIYPISLSFDKLPRGHSNSMLQITTDMLGHFNSYVCKLNSKRWWKSWWKQNTFNSPALLCVIWPNLHFSICRFSWWAVKHWNCMFSEAEVTSIHTATIGFEDADGGCYMCWNDNVYCTYNVIIRRLYFCLQLLKHICKPCVTEQFDIQIHKGHFSTTLILGKQLRTFV